MCMFTRHSCICPHRLSTKCSAEGDLKNADQEWYMAVAQEEVQIPNRQANDERRKRANLEVSAARDARERSEWGLE